MKRVVQIERYRQGVRMTILGIALVVGSVCPAFGQLGDPLFATAVEIQTVSAKSTYGAEEVALAAMNAGHLWLEEEVSGAAERQEQFAAYLDMFRSVISYAAQIYGFYYEVTQLVDNLSELSSNIADAPTNVIAVALSAKKSSLINDLVYGAVDIVNDVRNVCMSSADMTERERLETALGIRPKLKKMNKKVKRMSLVVKYSSLADVWDEMTDYRKKQAGWRPDNAEIAKETMSDWKRMASNVMSAN